MPTRARVKWTKGDELNKWVICLNCDHEYFIESFELNPCCQICESVSYEEADEYHENGQYITGW